MLATDGAGPRYVKALVLVPLRLSASVAVTSTAPAACAGVVAVIVVLLTIVTPVAAVPPIVTETTAPRFVPLIVMLVPPAAGPEAGATLEMLGAELTYVNALAAVPA
jgi:hypothetical protein